MRSQVFRLGAVDAVALLAIGLLVALVATSRNHAPSERAYRTWCANNLKQIHIAATSYMDDQVGRVKRMPHIRGEEELDGSEHSNAALARLVQFGYIDDPGVLLVLVAIVTTVIAVARRLPAASGRALRTQGGSE